MAEFDAALAKNKMYKQPGPDKIVMELFKWMNNVNKSWFLRLLNFWWDNKVAPNELFFARVVPVYKKGDTDEPSNYRSISLWNSFYKSYMILIRKHLQTVLEDVLTKTQFGFRHYSRLVPHAKNARDRGTTMRIELSLFLIGKRQLTRYSMTSYMWRYIDLESIDVIRNCYSDPCVFVEHELGTSSTKRQTSGIRQGCPLSPYLSAGNECD